MIKDIKSFGIATTAISTYSALLAILYQHSYWLNFGIHPFQYASLSDIVSGAIFAVFISALSIFLGGLIGVILGIGLNKIKKRRAFSIRLPRLLLIFILLSICLIIYKYGLFWAVLEQIKILFIPVFLMVVLGKIIIDKASDLRVLKAWIASRRLRAAFVMFFAFLIVCSISLGVKNET